MNTFCAKSLLLLFFLWMGCANMVWAQPEVEATFVESGLASWYGPGLHANTTAGGEVFDMNKLTAAHPSLPFDTRVKVTNLRNKKSVVVRINDRGPFIKNRIIDVSREAARKLDILHSGVARVRVEVLDYEIAENMRLTHSLVSIPKKSIGLPFGLTEPLQTEAFSISEPGRNFPYAAAPGDSETD